MGMAELPGDRGTHIGRSGGGGAGGAAPADTVRGRVPENAAVSRSSVGFRPNPT